MYHNNVIIQVSSTLIFIIFRTEYIKAILDYTIFGPLFQKDKDYNLANPDQDRYRL